MSCAGIRGWAAWVPRGDKFGSSECLNENPVDQQASTLSGAAGGAAASGAASLSAASLSAVGDASMHDSKGTGKRALGEEPEEDDCESSVAEFTEVTGAGVDEAAAATAAAVAAEEEEEEEEEEGQAVDPAPSRELPAQILNSTLYSNFTQYAVAVDTSRYAVTLQSKYTRVQGSGFR
jgi:hypothetical protein